MDKSLKEIVSDSDKQVTKSRNPLAKLYRKILLERNVNHSSIDHYLNQYLDDPRMGIPRNSKDRSSERGNLLKQLGKSSISWKIFVKGLRLLRPKHIKLIVEFTDQRGETSIHYVDIEGFDDEIEEDEEQ